MRLWSAREVLLSHMPLDLVTRASHEARIHPIETFQLSHPICFMRVHPSWTSVTESVIKRVSPIVIIYSLSEAEYIAVSITTVFETTKHRC